MALQTKHLEQLHHHLQEVERLWNLTDMGQYNPNCSLYQTWFWGAKGEVERRLKLNTPLTRLDKWLERGLPALIEAATKGDGE